MAEFIKRQGCHGMRSVARSIGLEVYSITTPGAFVCAGADSTHTCSYNCYALWQSLHTIIATKGVVSGESLEAER